MSFIKPIKNGRLKDKRGKTWVYDPSSYDDVLSPYDGVVDFIDPNLKDGTVRFAHNINDKIFFSELEGVKDFAIHTNMKVGAGEKIGKPSGNEVKLEIMDKNKDKVDPKSFFDGSIFDSSSKTEKKTDKVTTTTTTRYKNDYNTNIRDEDLPNLFSTMMLTPLHIINKAFSSKKKEEKEQEELNEEIKRIRQLLK
jgi:hypothetical protein